MMLDDHKANKMRRRLIVSAFRDGPCRRFPATQRKIYGRIGCLFEWCAFVLNPCINPHA
jgi:hypothetical protein